MKKTTNLSKEEVLKIAQLARLPLTEEEVTRFTQQLGEVLDYFSTLNEVDTTKVVPTYQSTSEKNRFQEQKLESDTLSSEDVLKNAKDTQQGYILTKQVNTASAGLSRPDGGIKTA